MKVANKGSIPEWIQENISDDMEWSEYILIARKEETQKGSRVQVDQTVKEPRRASVSGKEVKDYLREASSVTTWVVLIVAGVAFAALMTALKEPMESSDGFMMILYFLAFCCSAAGVYMIVKSRKVAAELKSIDSFESLEPLIESALIEKVYNEEISARKKELGDQGASYAGYFCISAHDAASGNFEKAKSNFGLMDNIRTKLAQAAENIPEEDRKLVKTG